MKWTILYPHSNKVEAKKKIYIYKKPYWVKYKYKIFFSQLFSKNATSSILQGSMYPLHPLPVPSTPSLLPHFHPLVFNTYKLPVETSVLLCAWRLVDYQSLACVLWTGLRTVMQNKMSCLCVCPLSTGQARQGKAELIYIYIYGS
jgi:hypothetical protein